MNQDTDTKEEKEFEEAFDNLPLEVEDFMWSDAYTLILDAIQSALQLSEEQKSLMRTKSYELLLGTLSMEAAAKELVAKGFSSDQAAKVLYLISEEILERAKNITEFYTLPPEEKVALPAPDQTSAPSPADVLESLKARMTTPSAIAPSARKSGSGIGDISKNNAEEKPRIDPYREIPQ